MAPNSNLAVVSALFLWLPLWGMYRPADVAPAPACPGPISGSPPAPGLSPRDSVHKSLSVLAPPALGLYARVLNNGVNVESDTVLSGRVTTSPPDTIRVSVAGGSEYTVGFTFPPAKGLRLKKVADTHGRLIVKSRLSPESSRQTVVVMDGKGLLAGFTWQFSEKPVSLDLGAGVRLVQGSSGSAPVTFITPAGRKRVPVGSPVHIKAGKLTYTVFVHTSVFQQTAARYRGGDTPTGYILRALVLAD